MTSNEPLSRLLELLRKMRSERIEPVQDLSARRQGVADTLSKLRKAFDSRSDPDKPTD